MIYKKQNLSSNYTFKPVNYQSQAQLNRPCGCKDFCDFPPKPDCHKDCPNNTCWKNNNCPPCHDFCPPHYPQCFPFFNCNDNLNCPNFWWQISFCITKPYYHKDK